MPAICGVDDVSNRNLNGPDGVLMGVPCTKQCVFTAVLCEGKHVGREQHTRG